MFNGGAGGLMTISIPLIYPVRLEIHVQVTASTASVKKAQVTLQIPRHSGPSFFRVQNTSDFGLSLDLDRQRHGCCQNPPHRSISLRGPHPAGSITNSSYRPHRR
jgi:hypothetical protein